MLVELDLGVASLDANALHPLAQVFKLEVSARDWALELFVVVLEVNPFVVIQIDHLLRIALTLTLCT